MKLNRLYFLLVVLLLGYTNLYAQVQESMYGDAVKADIKVDYVFSYAEALKKAKAEHKLIFFNCFSDWAVPCHAMNQQVFSDQAFGNWLNEHFVNLWVEMTTEAGLALAEKYGVGSMPYYLVLDENGEVVHRLASGCALPGFQKRVAYALNPKTSYRGLNKAYEDGKHGKKFLREYASVLRWGEENEKYEKIAGQYFRQLKPSQWCKKENWLFFLDRMKQPDSLLIDYLFEHKVDFVKENGAEDVNNAIVSLYYADAMAYASGSMPYTPAAGMNMLTQLQKGDISDTNEVYSFLEIASLRHDRKYAEMLDYLAAHIGKMDSRVAEILDWSLGNLPEMGQADRKMVAAYLEKRMEGGDEYTRRHYGSLIDKILNFKGMIVEDLSLEKALQKAKEEGKYVFMDCYTSWCGPCKYMSETIFPQEKAGEFFNPKFVCVKFDMEKGEGPELAKKFGVRAYPTFVILNTDGTVRHKFVGGGEPDRFIERVKDAFDDNKATGVLDAKYAEGARDKEFLAKYVESLISMYSPDASKVAAELYGQLTDEEKVSADYWFIFNNPDLAPAGSEAYEYLLANREKFAQNNTEEAVDKRLSSGYQRKLMMIFYGRDKSTTAADLDQMKKEIVGLKLKNEKSLVGQINIAKALLANNPNQLLTVCEKEVNNLSPEEFPFSIIAGAKEKATPLQINRWKKIGQKLVAKCEDKDMAKQMEQYIESMFAKK